MILIGTLALRETTRKLRRETEIDVPGEVESKPTTRNNDKKNT